MQTDAVGVGKDQRGQDIFAIFHEHLDGGLIHENWQGAGFLNNNFTVPALTDQTVVLTGLDAHGPGVTAGAVEVLFGAGDEESAFYGTSPNAVRTQIWTTITVYLLVAMLKKVCI